MLRELQAQRAAKKVDDGRELFCAANECPNKWSIDAGNGRLCGAHAFAEKSEWPRITDGELRRWHEHLVERKYRTEAPPAPPVTLDQKRAILNNMRAALSEDKRDHRAWARKLKERDLAGEKLSAFQRSCYKEALREV